MKRKKFSTEQICGGAESDRRSSRRAGIAISGQRGGIYGADRRSLGMSSQGADELLSSWNADGF